MRLYHGSNLEIVIPKLMEKKRILDFGNGFYLTTSMEQANRWAELVTKRRKEGSPIVSVFEMDENRYQSLSVLRFDSPNAEWLDCVSKYRSGRNLESDWDMIIGPVANDNTMPVLNLYFDGILEKEETIKRLLPQKLKDQFVCKTEKALSALKFIEVIYV